MATRQERKAVKAAKKEAKREYRRLHPGRIRKNLNDASANVKSVRDIYREMGQYMHGDYVPEEETEEENINEENSARIRHTKGKFTVTAHPTAGDLFKLQMNYELRTASGVFALVVDGAALILLIISIFAGPTKTAIVMIALILLLLLLIGPGSIYLRALFAAKHINTDEGRRTYCFSSAGFDVSSEADGYYGFSWDMLYSAIETEKCFYIYIGENDGFTVPKEDVRAAGRKPEQLADLIEKHSDGHFKRKKEK